MNKTSLSLPHALLAIFTMAIWGSNFVVIKAALAHIPPLSFAALRFSLAFVPAVFFLKRPDVPVRNLAAFGLLIGVGQFGFLYIAMRSFIAPGIASLVMQTQVLFTIGLAVWIAREKVRVYQMVTVALGAAGLLTILSHTDGATTVLGLGLALVASFSWALGNMVQRATPGVNSLAFVVWSSAFSVPPLILLSLLMEGPHALPDAILHSSPGVWAAIAWQSFGNSLFGYAVWGYLLARHSAAAVAPWALLIPVFGMAASALYLGEPLPPWKLAAAALIIGGLAINILGPRITPVRVGAG